MRNKMMLLGMLGMILFEMLLLGMMPEMMPELMPEMMLTFAAPSAFVCGDP